MATNSQTGEMPPFGMTTVPAMLKSVRAAVQPYVELCRTPSTTKNRPAAERIAPTRSNRGAAPRGGSTILRAITMMRATTRTCSTKEARQLMALVIMPPMSGPAAAPSPAAPLTMPKYLARSRVEGYTTVIRM